MGDEFHIKEFHCSSNRRCYGRMSSFVEQETPALGHKGKKITEASDDSVHKCKPSSIKSITILPQKPASTVTIDLTSSRRSRLGSADSCLASTTAEDLEVICKHIEEEAKMEPPKIPRESLPLSKSEACNTSQHYLISNVVCEDLNPFSANPQGGSKRHSSPHLSNSPSSFSTAKNNELKAKLTDSLSPSPFATVNSYEPDPNLEQLAAAATDSAARRPFFLAPFYGSVNTPDNIKLWRKALNEHILHILQSICIIKKLKAVPQELLLKKSVVLSKSADSSKDCC